MKYKVLIGLEIHIELKTKSKIFCSCSTEFGAEPNTQVCPVCLGLPGSMPVLNRKVVEYSIMSGLALNCEISKKIDFDRKSYFYPDLVKGFQTTQYHNPICKNGYIEIMDEDINKKIRIKQIHMEEDTGKTVYDEDDNLYLDYNRSGTPLIEIVTQPDINSSKELQLFLEKLKSTIEYTEVSDCRMEEGSLRCDVNINIIDERSNKRTEISELKNLNSFRSIARATEYEINRHMELIKSGNTGDKETRKWNEDDSKTVLMRKKEATEDYMYINERDICNVSISDSLIKDIEDKLPEFSHEKLERFVTEYELPRYDAKVLTESKALADFFEETNKFVDNPKVVSNWIMGDVLRRLNDEGIKVSDLKFTAKDLAELIEIVTSGELNNNAGKKVLKIMFEKGKQAKKIMKELDLLQINNEETLDKIVKKVIMENKNSVEDYNNGKDRALGFLVGQVMKESKGKANPNKVNEILLKKYLNK